MGHTSHSIHGILTNAITHKTCINSLAVIYFDEFSFFHVEILRCLRILDSIPIKYKFKLRLRARPTLQYVITSHFQYRNSFITTYLINSAQYSDNHYLADCMILKLPKRIFKRVIHCRQNTQFILRFVHKSHRYSL